MADKILTYSTDLQNDSEVLKNSSNQPLKMSLTPAFVFPTITYNSNSSVTVTPQDWWIPTVIHINYTDQTEDLFRLTYTIPSTPHPFPTYYKAYSTTPSTRILVMMNDTINIDASKSIATNGVTLYNFVHRELPGKFIAVTSNQSQVFTKQNQVFVAKELSTSANGNTAIVNFLNVIPYNPMQSYANWYTPVTSTYPYFMLTADVHSPLNNLNITGCVVPDTDDEDVYDPRDSVLSSGSNVLKPTSGTKLLESPIIHFDSQQNKITFDPLKIQLIAAYEASNIPGATLIPKYQYPPTDPYDGNASDIVSGLFPAVYIDPNVTSWTLLFADVDGAPEWECLDSF